MAKIYQTPGVYIEENQAFPNSAVPVPTAIPAFIGYTEKALINSADRTNIPTKISSFGEYLTIFGGGPKVKWNLEIVPDTKPGYHLNIEKPSLFFLFNCIQCFFKNGGSDCYIVSVGNYAQLKKGTDFFGEIKEKESVRPIGINTLLKEAEPTMLVIPDAVLLSQKECYQLQQQMLRHCGQDMKNRIAILDIFDGYAPRKGDRGDIIEAFRSGIGNNNLSYAAAYYPWLETSITPVEAINFTNINTPSHPVLFKLITSSLNQAVVNGELKQDQVDGLVKEMEEVSDMLSLPEAEVKRGTFIKELHQTLLVVSSLYKAIINELHKNINLLPPSGVMAGIYSMVDNSIGVFQSPANVSISAVVQPAVNITAQEQEDLNMPLQGKAVNAIRTFPGKGVLVWGARTLDGNSQDWRYINVRRTAIFIEQSIKLAIEAYVFESNDAKTWTNIKALISNFLTNVWQNGALAGASPEDAFSVDVGLGSTMTPVDILDGYLKVVVKIAISRPAEFIVIIFQQKMQQS